MFNSVNISIWLSFEHLKVNYNLTCFSANTAMPGQSTFDPQRWQTTDFLFLPSSETRFDGSLHPSVEKLWSFVSIIKENTPTTRIQEKKNAIYTQIPQ